MHDMFVFNDFIRQQMLTEIPIKGRSYTWSNMQQNPLLEQLNWVFTSLNWTASFPNTIVNPLGRPVSDHIPFSVVIQTIILKAKSLGSKPIGSRTLGSWTLLSRLGTNLFAMGKIRLLHPDYVKSLSLFVMRSPTGVKRSPASKLPLTTPTKPFLN